MIDLIEQESDPALDWRKINELIARVNAWDAARIIPKSAGIIQTGGLGVTIKLKTTSPEAEDDEETDQQ